MQDEFALASAEVFTDVGEIGQCLDLCVWVVDSIKHENASKFDSSTVAQLDGLQQLLGLAIRSCLALSPSST